MKKIKSMRVVILLLLSSGIMNYSFGENKSTNKSLIITDDNTVLMDSAGKIKLTNLKFGDHVLFKHDSFVSYNNIEGIIDLKKTNFIPEDWFECDQLPEVSFYLPNIFKDKTKKRDYLSGKRKSIECKVVGDKSIIIARVYLHTLNEVINDIKMEQKTVGNKIDLKEVYIDDVKAYYYQSFDEESEPFHEIILPISKNKTYIMVVYNGRARNDIAKKMLFSVILKNK